MLRNGALSASADNRETIDELVDWLCTEVNIEEAGFLPLTIERSDQALILRPGTPMGVDEFSTGVQIHTVGRSDSSIVSTGKRFATEADCSNLFTRRLKAGPYHR